MKKIKRHGLSYHPLYNTWKSMRRRCQDANHKAYKYYGGRGIQVCSDWEDIKKFINWAEKFNYENMELDRIDNDLGYSPENCHFVTPIFNKRKQRGRKLNFLIAEKIRDEYKTSSISQAQLSRNYNVSDVTINAIIHNRLYNAA